LSDLVLDASAAIEAALLEHGFDVYAGHVLHGPGLLWWEVNSVLHEQARRGEISSGLAEAAIARFHRQGIHAVGPSPEFLLTASRVAVRLGWAKVYDAAYIALALQLPGSRLVTRDERLRRGASRLVEIISPAEL
jgi:predicted nucleic acid-binding protein